MTRFILVCHQWHFTSHWMPGWHKLRAWHHLGNYIKECICLDSWSVSWRIQSWTHIQTLDILLHKVASHDHNCRINLCHCLYLFTESYLVADAVTYLSSPQCLNVVPPTSTCRCQVNTAPSWINVLVKGFQEPLTADLLLELISIHEMNVLFDVNVWFDAT